MTVDVTASISGMLDSVASGPASAKADGKARRFGVRLGDLPVLLPPTLPVRFFVGMRIYPVPRSMPRLMGLANLNGLPLPVFDPTHDSAGFAIRDADVVVIGREAQAIGLAGCGAPADLPVTTLHDRPAIDDPWSILGDAYRDGIDGAIWYDLLMERLTDRLVTLLPQAGQASQTARL